MICKKPELPINWLFLPGGPGLGSESFSDFPEMLQLPGTSWLVDYPNDGSNQLGKSVNFNNWASGLIELLDTIENVVLVAHSFSGMFVLSKAEIEEKIKGLVLMNTAPNSSWVQEIPKQADKYNLPDLSKEKRNYQEHPSDESFKKLTLASAPYFFSAKSLGHGLRLLERLPYSHASYDWAANYFHPLYQNAFIPKGIPTMIIGADLDHITPLKLFSNDIQWQRENIRIKCLQGAGHFPWVDSPNVLLDLFRRYVDELRQA